MLLEVRDLAVAFPSDRGPIHALDGVSFTIEQGGSLGIVGESGSGKTTLARALTGLLPAGTVRGSIRFRGRELLTMGEEEWRALRGRQIALAFQGSGASFDPVYPVGEQVAEPLRQHLGLPAAEAATRVRRLAEQVGLPPDRLARYPHQLSGGEKQRAMIAMALACGPELLVLDEPVSGLDTVTKAQVLDTLQSLTRDRGMSLIVISHDLSVVAKLARQTAVLYAGKVAEAGDTGDLIEEPRHPYTWGLFNAYPTMTTTKDLAGIRGRAPDPADPPAGCRFHPRCTQAVERCRLEEPPLSEQHGRLLACHLGGLTSLLSMRDVRKSFAVPGGRFLAVDDVSLEVREGEVVGLVGETGSGKSTLASLVVGLAQPDSGEILLEGISLAALRGEELKRARRRVQLIMQDPFEALSPRLTVRDLVREPLDIQGLGTGEDRDRRVHRALAAVNLATSEPFLQRHGHELSGGQLQRVAVARALVLEPKLIVADEPVSMLDASEQAKLLALLKRLQNELGMGLLLISHDLALVRKVSDRIYVMRRGRVVETGPSHRVIGRPRDAYTRLLIESAPRLDVDTSLEEDCSKIAQPAG